jgi:uncharacterized membrane protein HdeD (DUF308 family)
MKINEGRTDRIIRIALGIVMLVLGIAVLPAGWLAWVVNVLGAILLVTGIVGFCPLYALLKLNTLKK